MLVSQAKPGWRHASRRIARSDSRDGLKETTQGQVLSESGSLDEERVGLLRQVGGIGEPFEFSNQLLIAELGPAQIEIHDVQFCDLFGSGGLAFLQFVNTILKKLDPLELLFDLACVFTVLMTWRRQNEQLRLSEYYAVILAVLLGAHLLAMSLNLLMVFISLELISIGSYILAGV
jgi:hypothetical protein